MQRYFKYTFYIDEKRQAVIHFAYTNISEIVFK